eukprot:TRINITY_DN8131_c0_g1_i6.p2 TRINITY_DN8131_c0_g1~~TRINITY_DN8131_c0_g1_i6.p2  ORF type:complete len:209 (+),score=51.85 TRINITY_DN8131_c0_g1_i6:953-1579(+)
MTKKIENVIHTIESKDLHVPSDNLLVQLKADASVHSKLENLLATHSELYVEGVKEGERVLSINECAIPNGQWLCALCGILVPDTFFQCTRCACFRLLESYPNIIEDPMKATAQETEMLKQRRKKEKLMICGRDLLTSDILPMDDSWYLISSNWLLKWKAFIFNKPCKYSQVSVNPAIGVLPPGPITNNTLYLKDKTTLKDGLQRVTLL